MDIEGTITKFAQKEKEEAEKAIKKEDRQVDINPNCYIAKEIKYQTALLHKLLNEQEEIRHRLGHNSQNNGKQSSPLLKLLKIFGRKY